jgi:FkbM family methyltransferase
MVSNLSHLIPRNRLINLLRQWEFSTVIDAGSHDGTWSRDVVPFLNLETNPTVLLIDPITEPKESNVQFLSKISNLITHKVAIGSTSGFMSFNVASNAGESSSFLEFAKAHTEAAPEVFYQKKQEIQLIKLDEVTTGLKGPILLKLDLQGFEIQALQGAIETISRVSVIVVEASLVETYEGGSTLLGLMTFLSKFDFQLVGLVESFSEKNYGKMIQMDAVFARSKLD